MNVDNEEKNLSFITNISKKLNILYVEDEKEIRTQANNMLKHYFNKIYTASDGQEGLEIFKKYSCDIIFTDLDMPVVDGVTMIENIRKIDLHTPIIVISAHSHPEYFIQTIKSGIDGYLIKPYDVYDINELLKKIVVKYNLYEKFKNNIQLKDNYVWIKNEKILLKDDEPFPLTKNEVKLFNLFIKAENSILSVETIKKDIFGENGNDKKVRNLVSRLNLKLGTKIIEANYGMGYIIHKQYN
ncbi:MAG: response regulator [Campylobacterota bacterium]|nr:response regulator [Campylobacterota bacterium]